jgi:O6-methylguanine-DNA--protein-cysteine methyltransferase
MPEKPAPNKGPADGDRPQNASTGDEVAALLALHDECARELSQLAVLAHERTAQALAGYRRALTEIQIEFQSKLDEEARRHAASLQRSQASANPSEPQEIAKAYQAAIRDAQKAAQAAAEKAQDSLTADLTGRTDEANRQWNSICAGYLSTIKERVSRLDAATADPAVVAALAQSLGWISGHLGNVGRS